MTLRAVAGIATQRSTTDLEHTLDRAVSHLLDLHKRLTGQDADALLDAHFITDEDIRRGSSFATMIDAVTDPAWPLPMKKRAAEGEV